MYGKMAQRVGWNEEKLLAPKWHQLEWAGWVTSYCRNMVFVLSLYAGDDLVAYETDAVFSLRPLDEHIDIGEGLGEWGKKVYDDFVYLQSGCRFGLADGDWIPKYRGFDFGSISLTECLSKLSGPPEHWSVLGTTKRFVGFAQALHTDFSQWREFQENKARVLHIGGEGKRRHVPKLCRACHDGVTGDQGFHQCSLATIGGESVRHPLPWKDVEMLETQQLADERKYEIQ
jgi:hypothetical protein